ncbi:hypothetical protein ACPFL9_05765 [Paenarthrobacter sp. NyZ202]|uniref:hypothetical protein n=1 Tax=Paenarthrobacter sp. NyZ202 TaxID=3402689 RepID=UPI003CFB439B
MEDVESLLKGPRGRRLCLELAMEADQEVRLTVFYLGYDLDPGKGTSRVMLSMASSGEASPPPPAPTVSDLARMLSELDVKDRIQGLTGTALIRAIDAARYWQPPDGDDVLAANPVINRALGHLATTILEAPSTDWWSNRFQAKQWTIDWRSPNDPAPLSTNPSDVLAEWSRHERTMEHRAARERPADINANYGGEWWSIPYRLTQTFSRIPEGLGLIEDSLGWEEGTVIPVSGSGRILELETAEDWATLCRDFPFEVTASRRHDWYRTTGRDGRWVIPDWERVAGRWDAVHLSVSAYLRLAGRALDVDTAEGTASVIAGWNPDTTLWLTDVLRETGEPRQFWNREHNQDRWEQQRTH